jgi:transcriptional regulator with XRE-family HTH domain
MSAPMLIGERVRKLRKEKKLSQGDIEKRTGLLCAHISIVENGYITPTIQTLEKIALWKFLCTICFMKARSRRRR